MDYGLWKYIPKVYKEKIVSVDRGRPIYNPRTKRYRTSIIVTFDDGRQEEYKCCIATFRQAFADAARVYERRTNASPKQLPPPRPQNVVWH